MITDKHIVMTDERLDWLAARFIVMQVRERVHVSFEQYLRDPPHFESLVVQEIAREEIECGCAMGVCFRCARTDVMCPDWP